MFFISFNIKNYILFLFKFQRLPDVVDFPTPPFPDATTITFSTLGILERFGRPRAIKFFCRSVTCPFFESIPWKSIRQNKQNNKNYMNNILFLTIKLWTHMYDTNHCLLHTKNTYYNWWYTFYFFLFCHLQFKYTVNPLYCK